MAEHTDSLPAATLAATHATGVLPSHVLRELVLAGEVTADGGVEEAQIQPASIDLRLGPVACRVRASFLPGAGATVEDKIKRLGWTRFPAWECGEDLRLD